jgi:nitrogen fixation protein FixH
MGIQVPSVRQSPRMPNELTGGKVLAMLVVFFGLVMVVNFFMMRAAISTFGGVDTPSSYEAGLTYMSEEAVAEAQSARKWKVEAALTPSGSEETVTVTLRDAAGNPITGATVAARLAHPVDERRDVDVTLVEREAGAYVGKAAAAPGQWFLDITVSRAGERLFRSQNRVIVE